MYQHNPVLKIIKPGWKGNKVIKGKFANGEELYVPSFMNVWKWKLTANPQKEEKEKDIYSPPVLPVIIYLRLKKMVLFGSGTLLF